MEADAMDVSPSPVDAVLSSAAVATLTSTVASTVGAVATVAAIGAVDSPVKVEAGTAPLTKQEDLNPQKRAPPPPMSAWDAHLESPPSANPAADDLMRVARCAALGLVSDNVLAFTSSCEFVSLGCCCAVSSALQLLGLKRNSYPFDWVRSSLEGILHCLDMQFEDFLTYSTYSVTDQYVIFGGTRWGGSFWHHNLEVPMTRQDMTRRVSRFYGRENIPVETPRFFIRCVNSTRELNAALRFKRSLCDALPGMQKVFMLFIVDLQTEEGPMTVEGQDGHGFLVYAMSETETLNNIKQGAEAFRLCSETYTRAIAFAVKHWAGESAAQNVRTFASINQLCAACVQFDGGDPASGLFTPRKFYGQQMDTLSETNRFQSLLAKIQTQMFLIPQGTDISLAFPVQCFGKILKVMLPSETRGGDVLHLFLNDGKLSATASRVSQEQPPGPLTPLGSAVVEELPPM